MPTEQKLVDWTDPGAKLPAHYELVTVKTIDGDVMTGWWTGAVWDGLYLERDDEIVAWQKSGHYGEWTRTQAGIK